MAEVELRFSALPEHVRTARLVAAAVARRAGVDEQVLDEVRLAVGEACSRAVTLHRSAEVAAPIEMRLAEADKRFSIQVGDAIATAESESTADGASGPGPGGEGDEVTGAMGLAVISGLVDDVQVFEGTNGGTIRMSWPTAEAACGVGDTGDTTPSEEP